MVEFATLRLEDGVPIYLQIIRHVKAGIAAGTVVDGEELPSRRALSALLGVNPNTIQKAFRLLEEEGWLQSHTGAKSLISATAKQVETLRKNLPDYQARAFVRSMKALGATCADTVALVETLWKEEEPE